MVDILNKDKWFWQELRNCIRSFLSPYAKNYLERKGRIFMRRRNKNVSVRMTEEKKACRISFSKGINIISTRQEDGTDRGIHWEQRLFLIKILVNIQRFLF